MAAGDINVTVVGNLTNDPELRFTPSGAAVASFTVATSSRYLDKTTNEWKDGEPTYLRQCVASIRRKCCRVTNKRNSRNGFGQVEAAFL